MQKPIIDFCKTKDNRLSLNYSNLHIYFTKLKYVENPFINELRLFNHKSIICNIGISENTKFVFNDNLTFIDLLKGVD